MLNNKRFMTGKALKKYTRKMTSPYGEASYDETNNIILSQNMRLGMNTTQTRRNLSVLAVGKWEDDIVNHFITPNLLQYNRNYFIIDPGGYLIKRHKKGFEDNGYTVRTFDVTNVGQSNKYNPFYYMTEKNISLIVDAFFDADDNSSWIEAEKTLLSALIMYLEYTELMKNRTFSNILK